MATAVWWIRRDLRLHDNTALYTALNRGGAVVPVFVLDPALLSSPYAGEKRKAFLFDSLRELDRALQQRGSRLIVRSGRPFEQLEQLCQETQAEAVFAERDYSPFASQRDSQVAETLPLHLTGGLTVHEPGTVTKQDGEPYVVFTPYSRTWREMTGPGPGRAALAPDHIPSIANLHSVALPDKPALPARFAFLPGEKAARERLLAFTDGPKAPIFDYAERRNRMDLDGTARLSPYLRFGLVSAREVVSRAFQAIEAATSSAAREGAEAWLTELIWREFYITILHQFPHVRAGSFRSEYDRIDWKDDAAGLEAWQQGQTGYPIVDAAMRQMNQSGWMHNRARMIVASFLVKDLLIDWRSGETWFMKQLVDGDPAANNGGWQWAAGTGTDAAPYFRIFNPTLQGKKFDPEGAYVRRWLPELAPVPDKYLHEPWRLPEREQRRLGFRLGHDYPEPIVDHKTARESTLAAYARARDAAN